MAEKTFGYYAMRAWYHFDDGRGVLPEQTYETEWNDYAADRRKHWDAVAQGVLEAARSQEETTAHDGWVVWHEEDGEPIGWGATHTIAAELLPYPRAAKWLKIRPARAVITRIHDPWDEYMRGEGHDLFTEEAGAAPEGDPCRDCETPWSTCAAYRRTDGGSCCPTCTHEADTAVEDDDA